MMSRFAHGSSVTLTSDVLCLLADYNLHNVVFTKCGSSAL